MPATLAATELAKRAGERVDAVGGFLEAERPSLGAHRVVWNPVERDDDGLVAASFGSSLRIDRDALGLPLVETQEHGCSHRGRTLPVLVDTLPEGREALRRDYASGCGVRRAAPDELDVDVGAAAREYDDRESRDEESGGAAHRTFVADVCEVVIERLFASVQ